MSKNPLKEHIEKIMSKSKYEASMGENTIEDDEGQLIGYDEIIAFKADTFF